MHLILSVTALMTVFVIHETSTTTAPSSNDALRLLGGATRCSGQVQINQGEWMNICRTNWGEAEGRVVCRQLGCGDLVSAYANYKDKAAAYPVWNEMVLCTGNEEMLMNCSHSGDMSDALCPDTYRAAIACHQDDLPDAPESMAVRLVRGTTSHSGRVEIYYNGEWGTVCGQNSWSPTDGRVVCHQLGYSDVIAVKDHCDPFGSGKGSILMSYVDCDGHEEKLGNCSHRGWYRHNCEHYYDAGVVCKVPSESTTNTSIRIVDGTTQYEGRVEIYYNGEWGTICDDGWDIHDAQVVCRQLGYGPALSAGQHYGEGRGAILQSDVSCDGTETSIMACTKPAWYPSTHCKHLEDAGVQCGVPEDPDVRVRLADGALQFEGRVEVYHNGEWGAVCGISFWIQAADVVCHQLGYTKALKVKNPEFYGPAELIILNIIQCEGTEKRLEDCQSVVWYPKHQDCLLHAAAVICDINLLPVTVSSVEVRLTGGAVEREGQVELFHDGQWGTICATGFDMKAAEVVCRQLGYYTADNPSSADKFMDGTMPLLLDSVNCRTGQETDIANCGPLEWYRHDWYNCLPTETAAVACHGSKMDSDLEIVVRLSNGSQDSNGRVEVYHLGEWGSICGAGLGQNEAHVICHQLGHKYGEQVKQYGLYGSGEEPVNIWALTCTGKETYVEKCLDIQWYDASKHICDGKQTAGVVCSDNKIKPAKTGTPMVAIAVLIILIVIAVVLIATSGYCILLRRSKRNAAATQMRYAVLDKQDNSSAY